MRTFITALAIASAPLTQAAADVACNAHGAVVTMDDGTVLYLGKTCEAAREGGGEGRWWNAASFLAVQIDGEPYMVREDVDCVPFCELPS